MWHFTCPRGPLVAAKQQPTVCTLCTYPVSSCVFIFHFLAEVKIRSGLRQSPRPLLMILTIRGYLFCRLQHIRQLRYDVILRIISEMLLIAQHLRRFSRRQMCSSPPQPEKTTRLLSFSESMVRVAPHAQTLILLLAAGGLLWYSSESLAISKADINLLNEKIENCEEKINWRSRAREEKINWRSRNRKLNRRR